MREVDRRTIELGISGPILMENAGHRVVEYLQERYAPLRDQRVVVLCGKGNNGGDGFVVARQLYTRCRPASLHVVATHPEENSEALKMLRATGFHVDSTITAGMRNATLVIDALLGTGLAGPARGSALELIREINTGFPLARVVAVDIPSGMNSDSGRTEGEVARADATVTFTAPKLCHALSPNCDTVGELRVGQIGSPPGLYSEVQLHVTEPADFPRLLVPRQSESNKGTYGHVLVVGGASGKFGAAQMTGLAALRAGAGLVTVASSAPQLAIPELMTERLPESWDKLEQAAHRSNVIAIGPGLGISPLVPDAFDKAEQALVIDADGLNSLAGRNWKAQAGRLRILTPHPGEMARLTGMSIGDVQSDRLGTARRFASERGVVLVLKGHRTVIAFPGGRAWINPIDSPALAKAGTGDVLTGMIAGMLAQFEDDPHQAALGAVYLHGLCGVLGARRWGDKSLLATELLDLLPDALRECQV
jgi:NAD(P)H-hydrate epimerase